MVSAMLRDMGIGIRMAATEKEQQELEQIERQVAELESNGSGESTRREIEKLQERIDQLRREMSAPPTAWQKTELARHPQRPQTLDYIERVFTDFSEIHETADLAMILPLSAAWRVSTVKKFSSSEPKRAAT